MTQRNKNIVLVVGFLLASFVIYRMLVSDTIALRSRLGVLEDRAKILERTPEMMSSLGQRERYMDSILSRNNVRGTSVQNSLLTFLNEKSANGDFRIVAFNEPNNVAVEGAKVVSYSFMLEGGFGPMMEVVYGLEQEQSLGKIMHLGFAKGFDYRKRKDYLQCEVILENLVSN